MSTLLIGKYQATIYPEDNGYIGAISLGFDGRGNRKRIKRRGRTKAAVTDKLRKAVDALETGIDASDSYTVGDAVRDWLTRGLKDRDAHTIAANRILAERQVIPLIGAIKLKELTADQVDEWLDGLTGTLATRSLQGVHAILKRTTRQAQARDKVLRNVAELVTTPKGKKGRPSKAMTLQQATTLLEHAKASRLHAYVVVSLLTGIRTEEARALRWSHVVTWVADSAAWVPVTEAGFDHERFAIYVWRSVRAHGDTKTEKSRRTLELYGAEPGKQSFAGNCLLARRLVERGVRFVQLYHTDWDHHGDSVNNLAKGLDAVARQHGCEDFASASTEVQERIIDASHSGDLRGEVWDELNPKQAWSVLMRSVLSTFYSHPWAWNEIGFGGPAYPRGYARLGVGQRESWEGAPAFERDPVKDTKQRHVEGFE